VIAIDHAEMHAFAGNMLEVGSWDEYLGDFTILVMSETARHALATRKYTRSTPPSTPCSRCRSTSLSATEVAASDVCSRKYSFPEFSVRHGFLPQGPARLSSRIDRRSLVVGRLRGGVDIRKSGSGNAGATNALRTQGAGFAIWVIVIDIAKGWIAAALLPGLAIPGVPAATLRSPRGCRRLRIAAILGHVFPVWHGFRGGKGVATLVGAYAGFDLALLVPAVRELAGGRGGVRLRRAGFDHRRARHAGLSTAARRPDDSGRWAFALACAALVAFTHRGNVRAHARRARSRARRALAVRSRRA
jgi:glycerol-3-phosphate acyltransferase PlsY